MKTILEKPFFDYLESINFEDKGVIEVLKTKDKKFGDYTSNISLRLTKALQKNPIEIAEEIKTFIEANFQEDFSEVTVTNPGFVNLFLSDSFVVNNAMKFVDENYKPTFDTINKLKINYEYVSANPTGDLHIGHARNAIVGDIVIRVLKYIGHEVFTEYYTNDGGNQMIVLSESVYYYYAKFKGIDSELTEENVGYHGQEIKDYAQKLIDQGYEPEGSTERERIESMEQMTGKHFLDTIKQLLVDINLQPFDK